MTSETVSQEIPDIVAGLKEGLGVLFQSSDVGGAHFWAHLVVGLIVLSIFGKLFMRWIGNVETRWVPLTFALIVPLLAWVLAWAGADVWLAHRWESINPLLIKYLCASLFALIFAYFVMLWADAITRTHALVALVLTYLFFGFGVYGADWSLAKFSKEEKVMVHDAANAEQKTEKRL